MQGYEIKPSKWLSFDLKELWKYRELFWFMAWRDIKVKYKQTMLGFIWVILQPLSFMIIFNVLWLKIMSPADLDIPYPLFAYSGLIFWGLFSAGISGAGESLISNSNIIKKVYFPRVIIPSSSVLVALFDFVMTLFILVIIIIYYHIKVRFFQMAGLFSLSILVAAFSSLGLGLIITTATLRYRDFKYVMPFFLQAFFFVSPVVYPLAVKSHGTLKFIMSLNPLAGAINIARASFSDKAADWNMIGFTVAITFFLFIVGLTLFRRFESQYSDLL